MDKRTEELIQQLNTFPEGGLTVICDRCGTPHLREMQTYLAIAGNIYLGDGGLVGNAFNKEGRVERMLVLCVDMCAREFLQESVLDYLPDDEVGG